MMADSKSDLQDSSKYPIRGKIPREPIVVVHSSVCLFRRIKKDCIVIDKSKNLFEICKVFSVHGWQKSRLVKLSELKIVNMGAEIPIKFANCFAQSRQFTLTFGRIAIMTGKKMDFIRSGLSRRMINLEKLNLKFHRCERVTDKEVNLVVSEVSRLNLRHLSLTFGTCIMITDAVLKRLGYSIKNRLIQLRSLKIKFSTSQNFFKACSYLSSSIKITDQGVEILMKKLSERPSCLQSLHLAFLQCSRLTDKALEFMGSYIAKHFRRLRKLGVDSSRCENIGDRGIEKLVSEVAQNLVHLQHLDLDFAGCLITGKGVEKIGTEIKLHLSQLQCLDLNLPHLPEADHIMELLQFIPSLCIQKDLPLF